MEFEKIKPRRLWYGVPLLILIVGISIFAAVLIHSISSVADNSQRIIVPGRSDIILSEPGKYTIFHEYRSNVNGRIYSANENLTGLLCTLKDKSSDQDVKLEYPSVSTNYSFGRRSGVSVLEFTITKAGTYELSAQYSKFNDGQETVLAITKGAGGRIIAAVIIGIASMFITLGFTTAAFIIISFKRNKAKAKMMGVNRKT